MSRRDSRQALMQDELIRAVEAGIMQERSDLAQRQFAVGVAQTMFEIDKEKRQVDLRSQLLGEVSTLNGSRVGDKDRFDQAVKQYGAGMDPRDLELLVGAKRVEVYGGFEAVDTFEKTTGLTVPKVERTEVGADGASRSWQEYDLQSARKEAELLQGELETMSPTTRYSIKSNLPEHIPTAVRVEIGRQHEQAKVILDHAVAEGWITEGTLESLYLPDQTARATSMAGVDPDKPSTVFAPRLLDLDRVKSLAVKDAFDPTKKTTLAQRYSLAQNDAVARAKATEGLKASTEVANTTRQSLQAINTLLNGEMGIALPEEARDVLTKQAEQLALQLGEATARVQTTAAVSTGAPGPARTAQLLSDTNQRATSGAMEAAASAEDAAVQQTVSLAANPGLSGMGAKPGGIVEVGGIRYKVTD
jgi:hypothetical protein